MSRRALILSLSATLEERHELMALSLKSNGWSVSFIGWDRCKGKRRRNSLDVIDKFDFVRLAAPYGSIRLGAIIPQYYYELFRKLSGFAPPDLVIITHMSLLPFSATFSCPVIYDSFEFFSMAMACYMGPLEKAARPLFSALEAFLVKHVDGVVAVDSQNGWLKKFFEKYNKNVQVIFNVPSKEFDPVDADVDALRPMYQGRRVIASVGGLAEDKGLRVTLDTAALVVKRRPDTLFLFIGSLLETTESVALHIALNNLQGNVVFLPFMPYAQMLGHLHYARIGLIMYQPSRIDIAAGPGGGRKTFTYMQAGIPIIGPSFGEVGSIIVSERCGLLVDTSAPDDVADSIVELLDHPEEAGQMGQRGREAFAREYCWESEGEKFIKFIGQFDNR